MTQRRLPPARQGAASRGERRLPPARRLAAQATGERRTPPARLGKAVKRGHNPPRRTRAFRGNAAIRVSLPWVVGMTTAARRVETLERTLRSVLAAGWSELHLFVDGAVDVPAIEGLSITQTRRQTPAGCYPNWLLALAELWLRHPAAQRYLLLQDDLVLCKNTRPYLDRVEPPRDGIVSLYAAAGREGQENGFRVLPQPLRGMGALAYCLSNQTVMRLLTSRELLAHRLSPNGHKWIDMAARWWLKQHHLPEWTHTPSLVQHVAQVSSIDHGGPTGKRRSTSFPGEAFDALSMLAPQVVGTAARGRVPACDHRQEIVRDVRVKGCGGCGGKLVQVLRCDLHGECVLRPAAQLNVRACDSCPDATSLRPPAAAAKPRPAARRLDWRSPQARWVTSADLARDTLLLAAKMPHGVTAIAGVARSGVPSAALLATHLHLPLLSLSAEGLVDCGHGYRLDDQAARTAALEHVLVIDDTTWSGGALKRAKGVMRTRHARSKTTFAVVYHNPAARLAPDLWAVDLPSPHFLEWCFFNSSHATRAAFDFDGVFCPNPSAHDCDDGPRFTRWVETVAPLPYLPRRRPIPLVITACLERYRPQREAWMVRHGLRCDRMIMGPWRTAAERSRVDIAAWKAEQLAGVRGLQLYVESEPELAAQISELSGWPVLCPAAAWIF